MTRLEGAVMANVQRRPAIAGSSQPIASAIDRFGGELFTRVATATDGNVILSPYSVAVALAMTRAGSASGTRTQIDHGLHLDGLDVDQGFNALEQALATRSTEITGQHGGQDPRVAAPRHPQRVDSPRAHQRQYLKASWAEPFDVASTLPGSFVRLDGSAVEAPFMHKTLTLPWAQGPGWQMVEIPYAGGTLAMTVIVPDTGRFEAVEWAMRGGTASFTGQTERRSTQLALPKFKCRTHANLVGTLTALGMIDLCDPDRADLSAMTTAEQLYVSDVLHETFVEVDETGTEAAAATAVVVAGRSAPIEPLRFAVDRPFLLAVRDLETNAVLFLGRVLDPTS